MGDADYLDERVLERDRGDDGDAVAGVVIHELAHVWVVDCDGDAP